MTCSSLERTNVDSTGKTSFTACRSARRAPFLSLVAVVALTLGMKGR
ncbi:MAG TPA: hypothetical protein VGF82_21215 [Terracidiphilus sp.]